ncbi:hypothetical protein JB92DRAFT_1927568 [Gautieria morchelliformis]|nr:hypothetical protein JB92DRAFT_1927568 [Gautieria morchelliformis]
MPAHGVRVLSSSSFRPDPCSSPSDPQPPFPRRGRRQLQASRPAQAPQAPQACRRYGQPRRAPQCRRLGPRAPHRALLRRPVVHAVHQGPRPWLLCPGLLHWRPGRPPLEPGLRPHPAPAAYRAPALTVPSEAGGQYGHSSNHLTPPSDEPPSHTAYSSAYQSSGTPAVREPSMYLSSSTYGSNPSNSNHHWEFPPLNTPAASSTPHSGPSLSSLLNHTNVPSGGYGARLSISTNQVQPYSSVSLPTSHSSSSMSPDSRPTTGYSGTSSMSSLPYEPTSPSDQENGRDYDHTHSRPLTPGSLSRPHSANKGNYAASSGSLSSRRGRRHSQAVSPYPSPYEPDSRPLSAPDSSLPRAKSLMALSSSVDNYYMQPAQAEFAYSPAPQDGGHQDVMDGSWGANRVRPSTSQSSLSAASHSSSSAANTPPRP